MSNQSWHTNHGTHCRFHECINIFLKLPCILCSHSLHLQPPRIAIVPVPLSCCKIAMHGYGVYSKKLSLTEKSPFYRQIYPYSIMWGNGTCNKPFCAASFFEISIAAALRVVGLVPKSQFWMEMALLPLRTSDKHEIFSPVQAETKI